jgi:hypothetical protein
LGIYLNEDLNWDEQWEHVQSKTNPVKYLIMKLKKLAFRTEILVNIYRSLVLSLFAYSAPILCSVSKATKSEMIKHHERFLSIIGITAKEARNKFKIPDILPFIDSQCLNTMRRITNDPQHPLTKNLNRCPTRGRRNKANNNSNNCPFIVPVARKTTYSNSFVPRTLRIWRDGTEDKYTNDGATNQQ